MYSVPKNSIFWKNKEIHEISLSKIRNEISYVSQDPFLFSESLKWNLTLGREI